MIDMTILQGIINSLACPECFENTVVMYEEESKKKGLATCLLLSCSNSDCLYESRTYTSGTVQTKDQEEQRGSKYFEINLRSVYALRSCGVGHSGMVKFCCMMNMPPPMTANNYTNVSNYLRDSVKVVAHIYDKCC